MSTNPTLNESVLFVTPSLRVHSSHYSNQAKLASILIMTYLSSKKVPQQQNNLNYSFSREFFHSTLYNAEMLLSLILPYLFLFEEFTLKLPIKSFSITIIFGVENETYKFARKETGQDDKGDYDLQRCRFFVSFVKQFILMNRQTLKNQQHAAKPTST